jgi:hypothetical protein
MIVMGTVLALTSSVIVRTLGRVIDVLSKLVLTIAPDVEHATTGHAHAKTIIGHSIAAT